MKNPENINIDDFESIKFFGVMFIKNLQKIANNQIKLDKEIPESIKIDWRIISEWLKLEHTLQELDTNHLEIVEKAWLAYLARGDAPSLKLKPVFQKFSSIPKKNEYLKNLPPPIIINIFDSLLATREEIVKKRLEDNLSQMKDKNILSTIHGCFSILWIPIVLFFLLGFFSILSDIYSLKPIIYIFIFIILSFIFWKKIDFIKIKYLIHTYRKKLFYSSIWVLLSSFIIYVFNPLELDWNYLEFIDYLKAGFIITLPILYLCIEIIYKKFIDI